MKLIKDHHKWDDFVRGSGRLEGAVGDQKNEFMLQMSMLFEIDLRRATTTWAPAVIEIVSCPNLIFP